MIKIDWTSSMHVPLIIALRSPLDKHWYNIWLHHINQIFLLRRNKQFFLINQNKYMYYIVNLVYRDIFYIQIQYTWSFIGQHAGDRVWRQLGASHRLYQRTAGILPARSSGLSGSFSHHRGLHCQCRNRQVNWRLASAVIFCCRTVAAHWEQVPHPKFLRQKIYRSAAIYIH